MSGAERARVTIGDVAKRAGASPAAVSLALRGRPGVSDATRRRITAAAVDLGYHVRPAALPTAERTIGVLVADRPDAPADSSYGGIVAALNHVGATRQWDLRLGLLPIDRDDEPIGVPPLAGNPSSTASSSSRRGCPPRRSPPSAVARSCSSTATPTPAIG